MSRYTRKKNKKSKSKYNKKNKKTKQKGGFLKGLTTEIVRLWTNPHSQYTPNDCCPCVFSLLGMPQAAVDYLRAKNINGFSKEEIEHGFNLGYPDYSFNFHKSENLIDKSPEMVKSYLEGIWSTIPKNFATVGGIARSDGTKHCIVLAKDDDNLNIILDAQVGQGFSGIEGIYKYLADQNVRFVYVLQSQKNSVANPEEDHQPLILNPAGRKLYSKGEGKEAIDKLASKLGDLKIDSPQESAAAAADDDIEMDGDD